MFPSTSPLTYAKEVVAFKRLTALHTCLYMILLGDVRKFLYAMGFFTLLTWTSFRMFFFRLAFFKERKFDYGFCQVGDHHLVVVAHHR